MRKIKSALLLFFVSLSLYAGDRIDEIRKNLLDPNTKKVTVVAHRGDWRYATENSIEGIKNAIKLGVDVVELDVQQTKDGILILMHDSTLDRTTTGKGKVKDHTLAEIKKLKLRNGCAIRTAYEIPTLEEAMLTAKGKIMINLDKAYPVFDEVYAILEKTGTTRQVIMKGSQPASEVKKDFGKYLDKVIYMPIVNLDNKNAENIISDFITEIQPVAFELLFKSDANRLPHTIKNQLKGKSLIWYNTLWDTMAGGHDDDMSLKDPDKGYGYLINTLGARIIQTDRPEYLLNYLRKKKLHK